MFFELAPVHGVHGGHDSGEGPVLSWAFQPLQPGVVLAEPLLDALDACPEGDELSPVFARGFDQDVEHGDDGRAQDVGDALVDAGVEGGGVGRGRVFHRLCACQVLHVEEVHTDLTCGFAVSEQHGDVEDGAPGEEGQGAGA
ncbi:hypothetical protein ACFU3E_05625 [Streptomyces sp. NPDC057424]|uniref:hypothetical protein n=1 Tax=Streptomyces sp. NPDC057424 TaxID=3346127 RepID=UPI0036CC2D2F